MALIKTALPITTRPWDTAKTRFLECLTESEKSMFNSASLENLFYQSSGTFERFKVDSKLWKFQVRIQPLLDAVEEYGAAMDVYANASSLILCPIWGSIRVVIHLARGFGKYFEKLIDMFGRIGEALPRFRVYERLFPEHERLLAALAASYLDIIIFCVDAKELFGKAKRSAVTWTVAGKVIWKSFEQKFSNNYLDQFLRHQKLVEKEAGLSHMIEAKNARDLAEANQLALEKSRREIKRRQLLSVLSTLDYATQHQRVRHMRHPGTCNWLLRDSAFKAWLHAQDSSCFACYGIPGSGKTVLSASVAEELAPVLSEPHFALCYYYCDYSDAKTLDASTVIGTLIRQLLERTEIPEHIESRIFSSCEGLITALPLHDLLDLFEEALKLFSTCHVMIDGIDELPRESQLTIVAMIKSIMGIEKTLIKALISSRCEENDIRRALRGPNFYSIEISTDNISNDIQVYINDEVNKRIKEGRLVLGNPCIKDEIVKALTLGAKDMFLWVKFQLEDLCEAVSDNEIRKTLHNLPKDLAETYDRILKKIRASGAGRFEAARKMFKWILCARRPLLIEELREAVSLDIYDSCLKVDKIPSGDSWRLIQICGNLAVLNRDDSTVRLAHHTVQQFLLTQQDVLQPSPTPSSPIAAITLDEVELEIGQLCVTYLCFSDFQTQISKRELVTVGAGTDVLQSLVYSQFPVTSAFGKIATSVLSGWSETHLERRPVTIDLSVYKSERPLAQGLHHKFKLLDYVVHNWARHASTLTPLSTNWGRLKDIVFERQFLFDVKPWESDMYTSGITATSLPYLALFRWAVDEGSINFLKLLEVPPSGSGIWEYCSHEARGGIDPLVRATKTNQVTVFEYFCSLLKLNGHGPEDNCDVIAEIASQASPAILDSLRHWISSSDRRDYILKRLAGDLCNASGSGNVRLVNGLIQLGVDINSRVKDAFQVPKSPLEMATELDRTEIVSLLHAHGSDLSSHYKSLEYAVEHDQKDITALLLPDKGSFRCGEIFVKAIHAKNFSLFERLIDHGADVNFNSPSRGLALFVAIENYHRPLIRALLRNPSIEIFPVDTSGNTFLHQAAQNRVDLRQIRKTLLPHLMRWPQLLHARNSRGYTALQLAINSSSEGAFELLAQFNRNEHELLAALHQATVKSEESMVSWLLTFKQEFFPNHLQEIFLESGLRGLLGYFASLEEGANVTRTSIWDDLSLFSEDVNIDGNFG